MPTDHPSFSGLGLFIVVLCLLLRIRNPKLVDRVSLRLQFGMALVDFVKHLISCFSVVGEDNFACTLKGFGWMYLTHVYFFFNVFVALNLQLIILLSISPRMAWEKAYWILSFLLPLLIDVPLLTIGVFGISKTGTCSFKTANKLVKKLEFWSFNAFSISVVFYCAIIAFLVIWKLQEQTPPPPTMDVGVD